MPGFFDKMKAGVGEKVLEASIRSKEALETQQIKGKIGDLQGQKRAAMAEIGSVVYAMYGSGAFDQEALSRQCETIVAIDSQIKEKEAELEEVHRRAEESLAEQRRGEQARPATPTACPNCGTPIEGAPKFCPNCGNKLY